MKHRAFQRIVALMVLLALMAGGIGPAAAQNGSQPVQVLPSATFPNYNGDRLVQELAEATAGVARVSYHAGTGRVRFIGTDLDHPIPRPASLNPEAEPEAVARGFLHAYASLFGLGGTADELTVMRVENREGGRSFVRFQQRHQGIPVFGGELIVQMDRAGNVLSASGEALPDLAVSVTPRVLAAEARERAAGVVAKEYGLPAADLVVTEPELWIYNPVVFQSGPALDLLVWRMEVTTPHLSPVRELVLIEATAGFVALHFNQIDTVLYRLIYDNNNNPALGLPGNGPVRTEGGAPSAVADVNYAYDYSGDTYNYYWTTHGRNSLDNAGLQLRSTVRYCPDAAHCPYQNAFWNGEQMAYGQGYASADDVVGHELTHGVTDYESHLFYYRQSGAINEAFSDIWGEFVDLTNARGNDGPGVRWLMGEDLPIGAIRSMANPPAYQQPDSMTSSGYECGSDDRGGVHTNSGVANKAAYLLVDGGSFNGYTVAAIGMDKTAKIFYEAQTNLLTSAADYADLYDGLFQACTNLVGTSGITTGNCQEVLDAVSATRMNLQPLSCPANEAPVCTTGTVATVWYDDLENPALGKWTHAAISGADQWFYPQVPNLHDFDATYATSGRYNFWGYGQPATANFYMAMTANVAVPAGAYLHFQHAYDFESGYDGGVLEYSTNSGSTWIDAGSLMVNNGYNGSVSGHGAFTGTSNGYISTRVNLASLAGQNVRFRFRITTDISNDGLGWFIDDIRVYICSTVVYDQRAFLPLIAKQHGSAPPPAAILNGNFELGHTAWTEYSSHGWPIIVNSGLPTGVTPHSGSWLAWLGGDNNETAYIQQQVTVPPSAPYLAYYHWIASQDLCGFDVASIWINGTSVHSYDLCTSTSTGGWVRKTVNLGTYAGQSVALQIRAQTDSSINSNLFVDDVSFAASAAAEPQGEPGSAPDLSWALPKGSSTP